MEVNALFNTARFFADKIKRVKPEYVSAGAKMCLIVSQTQEIYTGITSVSVNNGRIVPVPAELVALATFMATGEKAAQIMIISLDDYSLCEPCDECLTVLMQIGSEDDYCEFVVSTDTEDSAVEAAPVKEEAPAVEGAVVEAPVKEEIPAVEETVEEAPVKEEIPAVEETVKEVPAEESVKAPAKKENLDFLEAFNISAAKKTPVIKEVEEAPVEEEIPPVEEDVEEAPVEEENPAVEEAVEEAPTEEEIPPVEEEVEEAPVEEEIPAVEEAVEEAPAEEEIPAVEEEVEEAPAEEEIPPVEEAVEEAPVEEEIPAVEEAVEEAPAEEEIPPVEEAVEEAPVEEEIPPVEEDVEEAPVEEEIPAVEEAVEEAPVEEEIPAVEEDVEEAPTEEEVPAVEEDVEEATAEEENPPVEEAVEEAPAEEEVPAVEEDVEEAPAVEKKSAEKPVEVSPAESPMEKMANALFEGTDANKSDAPAIDFFAGFGDESEETEEATEAAPMYSNGFDESYSAPQQVPDKSLKEIAGIRRSLGKLAEYVNSVAVDEDNPFNDSSDATNEPVAAFAQIPNGSNGQNPSDDEEDVMPGNSGKSADVVSNVPPMNGGESVSKEDLLKQAKKRKKIAKANFNFFKKK